MTNFHNKCLRLHLKPAEDPPPDLDCLQLVIIRDSDNEVQKLEEVKLEEFDLKQLFDQSMTMAEVSNETQKLVWSKIDAQV